MIQLPSDFREFLRLLASSGVEYLVVGGYSVGYHGYPRATEGLNKAGDLAKIEGLQVNVIALEHLKANKRAAGRHQDLSDLEHLP
jgi:predicted nucleotidyltransferase